MKFGIGYFSLQSPPFNPRPHKDLYSEMLDEISAAEQMGFESAWLKTAIARPRSSQPLPSLPEPRISVSGRGYFSCHFTTPYASLKTLQLWT